MKKYNLLVVLAILMVSIIFLSNKNNHKGMGDFSLPSENTTAVKAISPTANQETIEQTIQLSNGIQLAYTEQGDKEGMPVILLHGFSDSRTSFNMVLTHLPSSLHVFSISQRGHGNSSKPLTSYDAADFADDVADFMKQKNIKEAVIVGHSMGGSNAQCFAVKYPQMVKGLVLNCSFATLDKPMLKEFKQVIDGLNDPIDSLFAAEFQTSTIVKPLPEAMLKHFIGESMKLPAHVWKGVAAGWHKCEFVEDLKKFDKKTLIVWGDKDAYIPQSDQIMLKKAIKNAQLLVYEGIGHALHWEAPERFAKDLVQFISQVP